MVNGKWTTVQYYQSIGVPIGGQRDTEGEFGKHLELCENNKNMTAFRPFSLSSVQSQS